MPDPANMTEDEIILELDILCGYDRKAGQALPGKVFAFPAKGTAERERYNALTSHLNPQGVKPQ